VVFRKIKPTCIKLPNGSHIFAHYDGTVKLFENFFLHNVFFVPEFSFNLISVQKIVKYHNWKLIFSSELCQIQDVCSLKMIGEARLQEGLYILKLSEAARIVNSFSNISEARSDSSKSQDDGIWHKRLGHPSNKVFHLISKRFSCIVFSETKPCDVCHFSRQTRLCFNNSSSYSEHIFDLIHVDIWGPYGTTSIHGHRFFLTIVDDHSRFCWIFLMKTKVETRDALTKFIIMVNTQFHKKIKAIRSDNGSKFICKDLYDNFGIIHQTSCIETPQENSIVQRKHRHILEVCRSLTFQCNIPMVFWSYAIMQSVFLINRLPTKILKGKTPYELVY